jgi:DNA primase
MPSIHELNGLAQDQFVKTLNGVSGSAARQYLTHRGITQSQIEKFGIGLAPSSSRLISDILHQQELSEEDIQASGLVTSDNNDRFRGRVMFPIHDTEGNLIAFGGRTLKPDGIPKYINSPETEAFSKREHLYNLNRARTAIEDSGAAIVVEGYMDVIGLDRAGIHNVVAACGTALGISHARLLRESAATVFLNFDSDEAGIRATHRAIPELIRAGLDVRVVCIPTVYKDADAYTAKFGADGYYRLLERSETFLAWAVRAGRYLFDNLTADGREAMLAWLMPLVSLSDSGVLADKIAETLGVKRYLVNSCVDNRRSGYDWQAAKTALSLAKQLDEHS